MIDKVEKIARMKGAVYDVRRREAKDGESGNKKENFKRMLESAMEKNIILMCTALRSRFSIGTGRCSTCGGL